MQNYLPPGGFPFSSRRQQGWRTSLFISIAYLRGTSPGTSDAEKINCQERGRHTLSTNRRKGSKEKAFYYAKDIGFLTIIIPNGFTVTKDLLHFREEHLNKYFWKENVSKKWFCKLHSCQIKEMGTCYWDHYFINLVMWIYLYNIEQLGLFWN